MNEEHSPDHTRKHILEGLRVVFRLTPQETNLMMLLYTMQLVTPEVIVQRLGIATEVRVAMYRLRRTLVRHGVVINSKRRFGYWLDNETKAQIKEKLAREYVHEEEVA